MLPATEKRAGCATQLKGDRCHVDGTLNLTDNISTDFDTNGYLLLPSHLLDSLRSYTVLFSATPDELDRLQRFYDFSSGSANSLFLRAGTFAAGCKFGGKTTQKVIFIINHKKWIR